MNRGRGWLCLAITILFLTAPITMQASAGPGNAGGPPRPPGGGDGGTGGSGPDPQGGGSSGDDYGGGPTPPSLPPPENLTATPALPNLVVSKFRADRDSVRVGSPVRFSATTSNIGHLFAPSALLTLYDGVVDAGHTIGSATVDLRDFEAKSTLTWTASGAGSHTIIAYADADHAIAETIESDNTASVVVTVSNGQVPGVPDLTANEGDVGLEGEPHAGQSTTVKVRVRNVGEASASSVLVRVADNGATVTQYTVSSIAAGSANVQSVSWTPTTDGAHFLNVTADPGGGIRELDEDNNIAPLRIGVDPIPGPTCVYNGQTVFQPVRRDEYVVPSGQTDVYVGCLVLAFNVTVYGTLRLLNASTLVVGKYYPLGVPWPYPVPIPFPFIPRHRVLVESGGLLEFLDSRMTARMATYGYGFEAKAGSAFYANRTVAQFPWGTWPIPLGGGIAPGGLVVRTTNFAFRDSTVAYGRLHGMYLAPSLIFGTLSGDTFLGNNAAGLAVDLGAAATASSSTFRGNQYGLLSVGSSPTITGSLVTANRYGVRTEGTSSTLLTLSQVTRNVVAGTWFQDTGAGVPRITGDPLSERNRFGAYALASNLTVDNSSFTKEDSSIVFDRAPSAIFEWSSAFSYNFTVTVANGSIGRMTHDTIGICYYAPCERAPGTTYYFTAVSCAGSTCLVSDQTTVPGVCEGILALSGSDLDIGNSTVTHIGCGNQRSLLLLDSQATVYGSRMGGDVSIVASNATLSVRRSTLVARMSAADSPQAILEDNDILNATVTLGDSPDIVFRNNSVLHAPGKGISLALVNSTNALVEDNTFDSPTYYPPGQSPSGAAADRGHIAVYVNSTATVRWNTLRNDAWGISLDDRVAGVPLWRSTYALIENNTIEGNGFVAVGVDTTTRADVRYNRIEDSSGWAIQMESGFPANTVVYNWVNVTHGFIAQGCTWTAVLLSREDGPGGVPKIGNVTFAWNWISDTNGTALRICHDRPAYVHNNTISGSDPEPGITLQAPTAWVLVENNTVANSATGVWFKRTDPNLRVARNTISGNAQGVLVGWGDELVVSATMEDNEISGNAIGVNASAANFSPTEGPFSDAYPGRATLRRNTIANNTYGVYVRVFVKTFNVTVVSPYVNLWDNNTITGNTYGVYLKGGYLPNGTRYPVWANVTGNNTIASNTYGIWIDGPTVDPTANHFWLWWNDVRGNGEGVHVAGDGSSSWGGAYPWAKCNWWNHALGPDDDTDPLTGPPDQNDNNLGQDVSDYFRYRDPLGTSPRYEWLNNTSDAAGTVCLIG